MTANLLKPEKKPRPRLRLDAQSRELFRRFVRDWVWPRRWQLAWTLFLTTCLAAVTGGYPGVIKKSFDILMGGERNALPFVLAAIVGITLARACLLYLQSVATNRFIFRITSDMQKLAFRHLIGADFALNFLFDRVEAAFQTPDPEPGGTRGSRQALGAQHQQGNEADQQQFREADTKHYSVLTSLFGSAL